MRVAYFDCFSGISGEMALGALVGAGADLAAVSQAVAELPLPRVWLESEQTEVRGIAATKVHVRWDPDGIIRTYANLRAMIQMSGLPPRPKAIVQRILRRMADAEARVRGKDPDVATFHDLGEVAAVVEVVGCALALAELEVERVFASPVPTGLGMVRTEHGMMPIPSPVVTDLLQGVPTYSRGIPVELVTATGAAIVGSVAEGFGELPMMRADRVGYGAGSLRLDFPNVLRVVIGDEERSTVEGRVDGSLVVETVVRGPDPDAVGVLLHHMMEAGALDAWASPAVTRTGPGTLVSAVVTDARRDVVVALLSEHPGRAGAVRVAPISVASPSP